MKNLNPNGTGMAAAILSGVLMLVIGVLAMAGIYMEGFAAMKAFHIWFDATIVGVLAGIVEAAVFSYLVGYAFAWIYNYFSK